jgi:anti-sigma28 factor (negative regulator of flagellin synthesis)
MDNSTKRKFILEFRSVIDSLPEVREDKITILRLQIQKHLYRLDPEKIAHRMIEESLQEILWQGRRSIQTNSN